MNKDWQKLLREEPKRKYFPASPDTHYSGWSCWADFLGHSFRQPPAGQMRPFEEAREFARNLGLKNNNEWRKWSASGQRPASIPSNPERAYKSQFITWADWLGYRGMCTDPLPFEEAREYARKLNFKSVHEWEKWAYSGKRPVSIPSHPGATYKNQFEGWPDWLGYAGKCVDPMPFEEARAFVRKLGLRSGEEWYAWAKSDERPVAIPYSPNRSYKDKFKGMPDWLGNGKTPHGQMLPFEDARSFARKLGLTSMKQWNIWAKSSERPRNIPYNPGITYKGEYKGDPDWLGYGRKLCRNMLPFAKARTFVRKLGLKTAREWYAWASSDKRPFGIPYTPYRYKGQFRSMSDWLGLHE
jgi:hypothetical protein